MNSCSNEAEIRRCRPLLGTLVEITARAREETWLQDAVNAAFKAMERIHHLMSVHDERSELSQLNRDAVNRPVTVSRETFAVLRRAKQLATESRGAFDYSVAPTLAQWGLLPSAMKRKQPGGWQSLLLLERRQICFLEPLALDLGGIAKGFAVDTAIGILRQRGVASTVVNAGGDLRVFGSRPTSVHLRHPAIPQRFAHRLDISDGALATSSPCFTEEIWSGLRVSHLVNPRDRTAITGSISVSVRAPECWLADALTKVVLNDPRLAETMLIKHRAEAYVLTT